MGSFIPTGSSSTTELDALLAPPTLGTSIRLPATVAPQVPEMRDMPAPRATVGAFGQRKKAVKQGNLSAPVEAAAPAATATGITVLGITVPTSIDAALGNLFK